MPLPMQPLMVGCDHEWLTVSPLALTAWVRGEEGGKREINKDNIEWEDKKPVDTLYHCHVHVDPLLGIYTCHAVLSLSG